MPDPRKTPFEVFRNRSRSERAIRSSHAAADRSPADPVTRPPSSTSANSGPATGTWMRQPMRLRITPATLMLAGLGLFLLVIIAYEIGHARNVSTQKQTDHVSTEKVTDLRHNPINGLLLRTGDGSLETALAPGNESPTGTSHPPVSSPSGGTSGGGDPRVPGYNYFCIATMTPKYQADAEKAVAFLQRNRVDAAIIPVDNRWLQVVALRGFDSASSPQAKEYESLLRSLGRAWKAEHRGWSDWSDLYAIKYKP